MAGKKYIRSKMTNLAQVYVALHEDLKAAGLQQVFPVDANLPSPAGGAGKFIFDSTLAVNPLHETQPIRIMVVIEGATSNKGRIKVVIATPLQITDTGETYSFPGPSDLTGQRVMGHLGNHFNRSIGEQVGDVFLNRDVTNLEFTEGSTMSSMLVASDHGLYYQVWEEGEEVTPRWSMFCVQVPADKDNGQPLLKDKSPIFCLYNCDNIGFKKFVVCEADIFRPSPSVDAEKNSKHSNAIINAQDQVSIARDNRYLVTMPNRLNTDRYSYTEELDMMAYVSADVIGEGSDISVTMYGEATPRVYRAMKATGPDNTKVRLLALIEGGGVPEDNEV